MMNAADALLRLKRGNERYVAGERTTPAVDSKLRDSLFNAQQPLACIATCADSRVSPELIFDCTAGELFVVRVAGVVQTPEIIGSVEYAVSVLGVDLVVIMAHSQCGAVQAAIAQKPVPELITTVIHRLAPTVKVQQQLGHHGEELELQINRQNVHEFADTFSALPTIRERMQRGLSIHTAYYELSSGQVSWEF